MDSEYPPLPSSRGPVSSVQTLPLRKGNATPAEESWESISKNDSQHREHYLSDDSQPALNIISNNGDVIIEYLDRDFVPSASLSGHTSGRRWLVASEDLTQNSPYFRALLDPNKFSEGRHFMKQKADWSRKTAATGNMTDDGNAHISLNALPTLSLPVDQFTRKLGVDAIELFLRILSFQSLGDDEEKQKFNAEVKLLPPSLVARLVEIADAFNSPQVVRERLRISGYTFGKGRVSLSRFSDSLLKMSEDRIRQIIYIARFLGEQNVFQALTHALLVAGSRYWVNGIEASISDDTFRWLYLTEGLEEELYYRRQCVLNTITDLQAYFLRAYGGLEETTSPKPTATNHPLTVPATSTTIRPRQFQCRFGFANSNACDAFHLGQMTRFFALRTKTIFLGSSLLDPDFTLDSDKEDEEAGDEYGDVTKQRSSQTTTPAGPAADITAIIASIKQFPDYQIDPNHIGCGVRRRIIPALDCIERFVGDGRGLLGVSLMRPGNDGHTLPLAASSWTNRSLRRAQSVDIRLSRITAVRYKSAGSATRSTSQEEDVRIFFTAKKRHWEA